MESKVPSDKSKDLWEASNEIFECFWCNSRNAEFFTSEKHQKSDCKLKIKLSKSLRWNLNKASDEAWRKLLINLLGKLLRTINEVFEMIEDSDENEASWKLQMMLQMKSESYEASMKFRVSSRRSFDSASDGGLY